MDYEEYAEQENKDNDTGQCCCCLIILFIFFPGIFYGLLHFAESLVPFR